MAEKNPLSLLQEMCMRRGILPEFKKLAFEGQVKC